MPPFLRPAAIVAALTLCVCSSTTFAAVLPDIGPTTISINGVDTIVQPGTPVWHPELNYWLIPASQPSYTVGGTTVSNIMQEFDGDPIMGLSLSVDNTASNSAVTINATKTMTVPSQISAVPGPTIYRGTVGISLTDGNGDGATLTDNLGQSVYQASIDGSPVLELYTLTSLPGPFNVSKPFSFTTPDTNTENQDSGFLSGGPAVNSSMTIRLTVVLSPHDLATISSNFNVQPVPEPASLALLGLGAVALFKRRR